ncbi:DUF493 family protein YbeD [Pantoea sp. Aalb]|uniref:DUF493 family protein YbeD n=1 Tax=Pantoea sp. Aalb TaxID=2576762 RepID=UPI001323F7B7|nr:DUF493 family protein YbeD [Pantoea sp. Aalb]MXP67555.1 DUF493 family protein [Pantoea sp. Aalb]
MESKLNKLLKFPTPFTYKVMGLAQPELINQVVKIVQNYIPGMYTPDVKISSKGNYYSISIKIIATNSEQIETLYKELSNIKSVRLVL